MGIICTKALKPHDMSRTLPLEYICINLCYEHLGLFQRPAYWCDFSLKPEGQDLTRAMYRQMELLVHRIESPKTAKILFPLNELHLTELNAITEEWSIISPSCIMKARKGKVCDDAKRFWPSSFSIF